MSDGQLAKAQIIRLEPSRLVIPCMFNPKEYTITKNVNWGQADNSTKDGADLTFGGGNTSNMALELFFDTYYDRPSETVVEDVRTYTDKLWNLTYIDESLRDPKTKKGRPPTVLFVWGKTWLFEAVIESMEQQFTLFMPNGMPVRAVVKVQLKQADNGKLKPGGSASTYHISEQYRSAAQASRGAADLRKPRTDL